MQKEIWKNIPRHPNYEVSNTGMVRSLLSNRILKPYTDKDGYKTIKLGGKSGWKRLHRLVYLTFNNLPLDEDCFICHKDDVVDNNNLDNLFYGNAKINNLDKTIKGRNNAPSGSRNFHAKLSEIDIPNIRHDNRSISDIAKSYEVTYHTIYCIKNNLTWKHV